MATLVLTTVGTLIGGPIGGAVGALLGQTIDAQLLAPKGREGPRLSDLRVQTSSYGTPIPRVMGKMRMAGTVIWSTDLIEHRQKSGGGKGRPKTTNYSYSVSLAIALSSRPISSIGRIWAEGNLLRGADGRFTSAAQMRVHSGGEDQAIDPLIAAAEGIAACPAYRGIGYVVLEDFDLAPFGNRIPSLTFEVVAEDSAVRLYDVARDAARTAIMRNPVDATDNQAQFDGWVHSAASRGAALVGVQRLQPGLHFAPRDGWHFDTGDRVMPLTAEAVVTRKGEGETIRHLAADARASAVSVAAFEPARDFQSIMQSAAIAGGTGTAQRFDLPAAMGADAVRGLALSLADRTGDAGPVRERPTGFAALACPPGTRVQLSDGRVEVVQERAIEGTHVQLRLTPDTASAWRGPVDADGGRHVASPDYGPVATIAAVFDVPRVDGTAMAGGLVLAASGSSPGWRGAAVAVTPIAGAAPVALPSVSEAAVIGVVEALASAAQPFILDTDGYIIVKLSRRDDTLTNASDADLLSGTNLALMGDEVIQFGVAEPLGQGRWRLSRILRGRLGTEDAMLTQKPGADFAMVDDALTAVPAQVGFVPVAIGGMLSLTGMGDDAPVIVPIRQTGRAARPLSPVHPSVQWRDDGGLTIHWVRRSRAAFAWQDGIDAPMDEAVERYRVTLMHPERTVSMFSDTPQVTLDAATVAAWRALSPQLSIAVHHIGQQADSLPLRHVVRL